MSSELRLSNGWLAIDPIYVAPKVKSSLINPHKGTAAVLDGSEFIDHPIKGICKFAADEYTDNGMLHPIPVKPGDIVLFPESAGSGNELMWWDGIPYRMIKYGRSFGHYTPDQAEVANIVYLRDWEKQEKEKSQSNIVLAKPVKN